MVHDGVVSFEVIMWAAQRIVRQHEEPPSRDRATGCCAQCKEAGCLLLTWAITVLAVQGQQSGDRKCLMVGPASPTRYPMC
jgi:hypothetical protein